MMEKILLGLILMLITTAIFAMDIEVLHSPELDVINQETAQENQETRHPMTAQEKSVLFEKEKNAKKELFPFESDFTPGKVLPHRLETKSSVMKNFFVIGDDEPSIAWLTQQKAFLKENKALGFITNVTSKERLEIIEKQTGWQPLLPASMQGGQATLGINHLPLMVIDQEVSQ